MLLGVGQGDTESDGDLLADKVLHLRIFADEAGHMNRSVLETGGDVLVVSQFTLYGDARKGRRPSFIDAAAPEEANWLYGPSWNACGHRACAWSRVSSARYGRLPGQPRSRHPPAGQPQGVLSAITDS